MKKQGAPIDVEVHSRLMKNLPKLRQLEWAKLAAWLPVVNLVNNNALLLWSIVMAGPNGITIKELMELVCKDSIRQRSRLIYRLIILIEMKLIKRHGGSFVYYTQNLIEAPWPEWVEPPEWALTPSRTKSTAKPDKRFLELKDRTLKRSEGMRKRGIACSDIEKLVAYHKDRFIKEEEERGK